MNRFFRRVSSVLNRNRSTIGAVVGVTPIVCLLICAVTGSTPPRPALEHDDVTPVVFSAPTKEPEPVQPPPSPETVWKSVEPRLTQANAESRKALDLRLQQVADFFEERKKGAIPFAETMLGYESKARVAGSFLLCIWDCAVEILEGGDSSVASDSMMNFVRDRFRHYVLDPSQVKPVLDKAVAGFLGDLKAIDSRLLVDLKADLPDRALGDDATPSPDFLAESRVIAGDNFVNRIVDTAIGDFGVAVTLGAVAGPVGGAVSSGIASQGLPLIGTAAGLLTNAGTEEVLKSAVSSTTGYDPQSGVTTKVGLVLDRMCKSILCGDPEDAERYLALYLNRFGHPDTKLRDACAGPTAAMERSADLGLNLRLLTMANDRHWRRVRALHAHVFGLGVVPPQEWFSLKVAPERLLNAEQIEESVRRCDALYGAGR